MTEDQEAEAMRLWFAGKHTKSALARRYGTHISSIKRAIKRHHERTQPTFLDAAFTRTALSH